MGDRNKQTFFRRLFTGRPRNRPLKKSPDKPGKRTDGDVSRSILRLGVKRADVALDISTHGQGQAQTRREATERLPRGDPPPYPAAPSYDVSSSLARYRASFDGGPELGLGICIVTDVQGAAMPEQAALQRLYQAHLDCRQFARVNDVQRLVAHAQQTTAANWPLFLRMRTLLTEHLDAHTSRLERVASDLRTGLVAGTESRRRDTMPDARFPRATPVQVSLQLCSQLKHASDLVKTTAQRATDLCALFCGVYAYLADRPGARADESHADMAAESRLGTTLPVPQALGALYAGGLSVGTTWRAQYAETLFDAGRHETTTHIDVLCRTLNCDVCRCSTAYCSTAHNVAPFGPVSAGGMHVDAPRLYCAARETHAGVVAAHERLMLGKRFYDVLDGFAAHSLSLLDDMRGEHLRASTGGRPDDNVQLAFWRRFLHVCDLYREAHEVALRVLDHYDDTLDAIWASPLLQHHPSSARAAARPHGTNLRAVLFQVRCFVRDAQVNADPLGRASTDMDRLLAEHHTAPNAELDLNTIEQARLCQADDNFDYIP